jgi:hypothetical protein
MPKSLRHTADVTFLITDHVVMREGLKLFLIDVIVLRVTLFLKFEAINAFKGLQVPHDDYAVTHLRVQFHYDVNRLQITLGSECEKLEIVIQNGTFG